MAIKRTRLSLFIVFFRQHFDVEKDFLQPVPGAVDFFKELVMSME